MSVGLQVTAWNTAGSLRKKWAFACSLGSDVLILSEVLRRDVAELAPLSSWVWMGTDNKKGLAVVVVNGWQIAPSEWQTTERIFLPVIIRKDDALVHLLGVCVHKTDTYVLAMLRALADLKGFLAAAPSIVAGDFNQSVTLRRARGKHFTDTVAALQELGLRSSWHAHHGEAFGKETQPTYYHQWRQSAPFHIDYAFVSGDLEVQTCSLGSHQEIVAAKLSDHAPLTVQLRLLHYLDSEAPDIR